MTAFRKGDVCTIEVVVDGNPFGDNDIRVRQPDRYGDIFVKQSDLTMVRPTFVVGDTVELVVAGRFGSPVLGEVKAIDGDSLWVRRHTGGLDTWEISRVRRADPDEPQPAEDGPMTPPPPPPPLDGKVGSEEPA